MDTLSILRRNGFTEKEATIYLATLELGMAPISVIAKKAGYRRSTTYEVLQRLSEKGIAEFFMRKNARYYSVLPPKTVHRRMQEAVEAFTDALPAFTALENQIMHKPRISFFEGKEDLRRLYLDCLSSTGVIRNYFHPEATINYFGWEWLQEQMVDVLVVEEKEVRVIMPSTPWAKRFLKERRSGIRLQKIIHDRPDLFRNEVVIYGDKVAHFSFEDDFGFLIQSKNVADTHRAIFDLAWVGVDAASTEND